MVARTVCSVAALPPPGKTVSRAFAVFLSILKCRCCNSLHEYLKKHHPLNLSKWSDEAVPLHLVGMQDGQCDPPPEITRRAGLRSTTMVRGADAGPANATDLMMPLRGGATLSNSVRT